MRVALKDMLAGLIFVGFGAAFIVISAGYDIGTARRMGPGYFPTVLGGLLVVLGAALAIRSLNSSDAVSLTMPSWRALILLLGAVLFFSVSVHPLGLVPALFGTAALAASANRGTGVIQVLLLASALTAMCLVIFVYGLGASIPLFGPALQF